MQAIKLTATRNLYLDTYTWMGVPTCYVHTSKARGRSIGAIRRLPDYSWEYRLALGGRWRGAGKGLSRKEAALALHSLRKSRDKAAATAKHTRATRCTCRQPKRHADCMYCGWFASGKVCGVCKEAGIDGPVIRGTERRTCGFCKANKEK